MKEVNLIQALENGLNALDSEHEWNNNLLHASDLSVALKGEGKCPRQLWYRVNDYDREEDTPGKKLMFYHGNRLHEMIAKFLHKGLKDWYVMSVEQKIENLPHSITGRLDCLIGNKDCLLGNKDFDNKETMVVDFKTVRGRTFNYLTEAKPSHKLQVQTYMMSVDATYGAVLYIDREGQNFANQYFVKRDDESVLKAIDYAVNIINSEIPPAILKPQFKINENKGPDSVKIGMPWQCDYCEYCNITCDGALPQDKRPSGICGKIHDDEGYKPKKSLEWTSEYVNEYLKEAE